MTTIRVLSPVGLEEAEAQCAPALPASLTGLTVGFLDNRKSNFDHLADGLGALLRARHGVKDVVRLQKANASTPAPPEMIAEIAKRADVVFAGSGD